jgi:hypothetical protein
MNENGQQASSRPRVAVPLHPAAGQTQKHHGFRSNQRFETLPPPSGNYPYRLRLEDIVAPEEFARIGAAEKLVFHVVGDTGGVKRLSHARGRPRLPRCAQALPSRAASGLEREGEAR